MWERPSARAIARAECPRHRETLQREGSASLRSLVLSEEVRSVEELMRALGVRYLAPVDARSTGLPDGSVDFISSTSTLEHVPEADIRRILTECRRLLTPGGVISSTIDMQDHYASFDRSITPYNFLKFRDLTWALVNPPLHFQNRLRLPDYERLHREAGLELVHREVEGPDPADLDAVRSLELAPRFVVYAPEELGARLVTLVARRS